MGPLSADLVDYGIRQSACFRTAVKSLSLNTLIVNKAMHQVAIDNLPGLLGRL
jgi:hypothetical protein